MAQAFFVILAIRPLQRRGQRECLMELACLIHFYSNFLFKLGKCLLPTEKSPTFGLHISPMNELLNHLDDVSNFIFVAESLLINLLPQIGQQNRLNLIR